MPYMRIVALSCNYWVLFKFAANKLDSFIMFGRFCVLIYLLLKLIQGSSTVNGQVILETRFISTEIQNCR